MIIDLQRFIRTERPWAYPLQTQYRDGVKYPPVMELWCHKIAFVITTCALRTPRQAVPALDIVEADRHIFAPIR